MAPLLPVLILFAVVALVLHVGIIWAVALFLLGIYAVARLWTRYAVRHLRVSRRCVDHAFTGDEVQVDLTVRNVGALPIPWIEVSESVPPELKGSPFSLHVLRLGPRRERRFRYTLRCRKRGFYSLGPLTGQLGDVLGIEERLLTLQAERRITVYPRIVPLQRLGLPTRSALVTVPARAPLFEDPSRVVGVRDYRPGDSPRRIHWSATARLGTLVVKQYQPAITRETLLCLDLNEKSYPVRRWDAIEQAIVVAASLARHMALQEGLPVGLAAEGRDQLVEGPRRIALPPRTGSAQLMGVLEALARVQPYERPFSDLVRDEAARLTFGSTVVAITGRLDGDLAATMRHLSRNGHAPALVLVQPDYLRLEEGQSAPFPGAPVHRVWSDADLVGLQ